jgi:molybdopterin converting factor subunit 1
MRIRLRFFAIVREILGTAEEDIELAEGATARDVLAFVCSRDPRLEPLRPSLKVARNLTLVADDAVLADGDEVAILPPVAGGAPRFRLQKEPVDPMMAAQLVAHPGAGAVVMFVGLVRKEHEGRPVERLEYEAYEPMAERVLGTIVTAVEDATPGVRVAVLHRYGSLAVGEVAVAIAASAPHREEAFAACRATIERVKHEMPVWKKEFGPDGAVWVGASP